MGCISLPRGSSQPRGQTWVSHIASRGFTIWATREALTLCMQFLFSFIPSCLKNFSLSSIFLFCLASWNRSVDRLIYMFMSALTWRDPTYHVSKVRALCRSKYSCQLSAYKLRQKQNNQSPSYTWKFQRTSTAPMNFSNLRLRPCLIPVFYFPGCLYRGFGRCLINICKYLSYIDWGF